MSTEFVVTSMRLPKNVLKALKRIAVEDEKSVAQLVREAVQIVYLSSGTRNAKQNFQDDDFFKILGICDTGISDGAVNHDRDIYGDG